MYNNTIIQTQYKPYVPLPKKKTAEGAEEKQSEKNSQVVTPNNYSASDSNKQQGKDSYIHSPIEPPAAINIKQVLIDFNSTLNAIGAPEEVENEAKTYLKLVETQSHKENPNKKMIVSNLKIAADILDEYIATALKKPSKVVKEWIDALLLQSIDFKSNEKITRGAFETITGEQSQTEKLAQEKLARKALETPVSAAEELTEKAETISENVEVSPENETVENTEALEPQVALETIKKETNPQILDLIADADKFSSSPNDALSSLSRAFSIAQSEQDNQSVALIYAKIANVHDSMNNIPQALNCLNASNVLAYSLNDNNLKTQNHKQMGKIYDAVGYMDSALSHYAASLGIDGELDDSANQADTLNSVGKMYTDRYLKDEAIDFYKDALALAKETNSFDIMSDSFYNTAVTLKNSGENQKAMNNLKNAACLSEQSGNNLKLSGIYEQAGDLMFDLNCSKRACDLYKKAYRFAQKIGDEDIMQRLQEKMQAA